MSRLELVMSTYLVLRVPNKPVNVCTSSGCERNEARAEQEVGMLQDHYVIVNVLQGSFTTLLFI